MEAIRKDGAGRKCAAGIAVFARACASCHGDHGQGDAIAGAINDPDFLALTSDQALRRYVITGRPDLRNAGLRRTTTGRPADFKALTDEEVANVTAALAGWRQGEAFEAERKIIDAGLTQPFRLHRPDSQIRGAAGFWNG